MLAGAAALGLEFADALDELVVKLQPARLAQALGQLVQPDLKALAEAIDDRRLLGLAQLGVAVQQHLTAVRAELLLQPQGLAPGGLDGHGLLGLELPLPAAAHDQVAVAVRCQPVEVGLGGDARVHDDHRADTGLQALKHALQRGGFSDVARERLGAAHEATAVQHQAERDQGAVTAFLLGATTLGLGVAGRLALEVGVGQVEQGDGLLEPEEGLHGPEDVVLDGAAVALRWRCGGTSARPMRGTG